MNVRNAMITTIITAGLVSSAVYADDVNTAITIEPAAVNSSGNTAVNPKVTIQDYVDAAREAENVSFNEATAQNVSRWEQSRVL